MSRRRSELILRILTNFLLCLFLVHPNPAKAESDAQLLTPKRSTQKKKTMEAPTPPAESKVPRALRPKNIYEREEENWGAASPLESVSFSLLFGTPLGYENFYDKRFHTLGDFFLFSIPLSRFTKKSFLHIELGPGFTFSRLKLTAPDVSYSHLYLVVPVHLRYVYTLSKTVHFEAFVGALARVVEYDSRDTTDGGTRTVKSAPIVSPDGGLGLSFVINPALKARFNVGYLHLAGGLELTL